MKTVFPFVLLLRPRSSSAKNRNIGLAAEQYAESGEDDDEDEGLSPTFNFPIIHS